MSEELEQVEKYIKPENGEFCIYSHTTGKKLSCYPTKEAAQAALERMKRFRKEFVVKIAATQEEQRLIYGEVLVPDETDLQDHTITAAEVEKAAHGYALTPMVIGQGHRRKAGARPVETYIHNPEITKDVKPGSWIMVVKVDDDDLWEGVKKGEYNGFSIGALAKLTEIPEEGEEEQNEEEST